ncbi:RNA polymerase sigma factor [Sphingobium sp. SCG-1]|uniref:RNA polymerase sigma factor n=1 Tax=Sphingobium sp. SCG-1 TaxID=2072936 RepID=UPI0016701238|nr:RNA polymerase sigma factor [Sphingobium sp. SCG-1]
MEIASAIISHVKPLPASWRGCELSPTVRSFLQHETALKRFLGRLLPTAEDVEDIAQEAILRAISASATQTVEMPKAFLFRIARNLALNDRAKMWNTTTTLVQDYAELDVGNEEVSGEDRIDSHRKFLLLEEAISHLPAQCRRIFLMRKLEDQSHKEIAAKFGISVSTVEKHIAIGLRRCASYLYERGYDVGDAPRSQEMIYAKAA